MDRQGPAAAGGGGRHAHRSRLGDGTTLVSTPGKLAALVGEADAALLLSGQRVEGTEITSLASLGPVVGLARLARGEIDRDVYARLYGHRGSHEIELSLPRPAEDPGWIDDQVAALAGNGHHAARAARDASRDADALLAKQDAARAVSWQRLARQDPRKAAEVRKLITRWAPLARGREAARSEVVRSVWVARAWVRRAGELTGHGDDLFFLALPEVFGLLRGERGLLDQVPGRRAVYESYRALPPYPALIRGRFDPARWAADPRRRVDYYDERAVAQADAGSGRGYYRVPRRGRGGRGDGAGAERARGRRPARRRRDPRHHRHQHRLDPDLPACGARS